MQLQYTLTAEKVLALLIETIETNLNEILELDFKNEFIVGEWYGYVECLEVLSYWKRAKMHGLDYDPEKRFSII